MPAENTRNVNPEGKLVHMLDADLNNVGNGTLKGINPLRVELDSGKTFEDPDGWVRFLKQD